MVKGMTDDTRRMFEAGRIGIERRRQEDAARREQLAAKLARYDAVIEENERLRLAVAQAATIIERIVNKRIEREEKIQ
jgi:ribosome-binding protein aMBF1 (putative translation factor)